MARRRAILILAKDITEANKYARLAGLRRGSYRAVRSAGAIRGIRYAEVHLLPSFLRRLDRHAILQELRYARTVEVFYVDPADLEELAEPIFRVVAVSDDTPVPEHHAAMVTAVLPDRSPTPQGDTPDSAEQKAVDDAQWLRNLARERGTLSIGHVDGELSLSRDEYAAILADEGFVVDEDDPDNFVHPQRKADFLSGAYREDEPSNGDAMVSEGAPDPLPAQQIDPEPENVQLRPFTDQEVEALDGPSGTPEPSEDAAPAEKSKRRRSRCKECGDLHFKDEPCTEVLHSQTDSFF